MIERAREGRDSPMLHLLPHPLMLCSLACPHVPLEQGLFMIRGSLFINHTRYLDHTVARPHTFNACTYLVMRPIHSTLHPPISPWTIFQACFGYRSISWRTSSITRLSSACLHTTRDAQCHASKHDPQHTLLDPPRHRHSMHLMNVAGMREREREKREREQPCL